MEGCQHQAGSVERMVGCSLAGVSGFEVYSLSSSSHNNAYVPENPLLGECKKEMLMLLDTLG